MRLKTITYKMFNLNKIILTDKFKLVYYTSLYTSIIQYGIIWGGAIEKTLKPLILLQN